MSSAWHTLCVQQNIEDIDYNMLGGGGRTMTWTFLVSRFTFFNPQLTAQQLIYAVPNPTHSTHGKTVFISN